MDIYWIGLCSSHFSSCCVFQSALMPSLPNHRSQRWLAFSHHPLHSHLELSEKSVLSLQIQGCLSTNSYGSWAPAPLDCLVVISLHDFTFLMTETEVHILKANFFHCGSKAWRKKHVRMSLKIDSVRKHLIVCYV